MAKEKRMPEQDDEDILARGADGEESEEDDVETPPAEGSEEGEDTEGEGEEPGEAAEGETDEDEADEEDDEDPKKARQFRKSLAEQMASDDGAKKAMEVSPFLDRLVKSISGCIEELGDQMDSRMRKIEKGLKGVAENVEDLDPTVIAKSLRKEMAPDFSELQALTKSLGGAVEDMGRAPQPAQARKAVGTILHKSMAAEESNMSVQEVGDLLVKAACSGLIDSAQISKFDCDKHGYIQDNGAALAELKSKVAAAG